MELCLVGDGVLGEGQARVEPVMELEVKRGQRNGG